MRKVLALVFVLLMATTSWAADAKISGLTALTAASGDDLLPIVDDPGGSPATKKITVTNFLTSPAITTAIVPASAGGAALGSTSAEWSNLYLTTGGIIYGEADQSNTLTSGATGWTMNLDLTVTGADIQLGATGVKISSDNDGAITFLGSSTGEDEDLTMNLDDTANTVVFSSSTGVTSLNFSAINLVTTGTISGKIPTVVNSDTASYSVTQAQIQACTFFLTTNSATTTYTLPGAEVGGCACFRMSQGNAQILRIDTDGSDYIVMSTGARTSTAGDYYGATSDDKNQVCVIAFDTTDWYVTSESGTWTEE